MSYGKVLTDDVFQKIKVVGRFHCKIWVGLFRSSDTELELGACPAWKTHFIQCGRNTREEQQHVQDNLVMKLQVEGFPGGANGKEPTCQCRRHETWFNPWAWKSPQERNGCRSSMDLTEAEENKKRWQEYTEELY